MEKTIDFLRFFADFRVWKLTLFQNLRPGINKGGDDNIIETPNPVKGCYQARISELSVKRYGAVGNKLVGIHSDMSDFSHKKMGFHGK